MDTDILKEIGIHSQISEIKLCIGGMNTSWQVITESKNYQVKMLSDIYDVIGIKKYIEAEVIGKKFKEMGISAVTALQLNGDTVHYVKGRAYLVYPWVDGQCIDINDLTEQHCSEIGKTLYQLHSAKFTRNAIDSDWNDCQFPDNHWKELSNKIQNTVLSLWIQDLEKYDEYSKKMVEARDVLRNDLCISHRDLRPGNLIWSNDSFKVLDWECTGPVNPQLELFCVALLWSGVEKLKYNQNIFDAIIHSYYRESKKELHFLKEESFWSSIGDNLWWLNHNLDKVIKRNDIDRAINESERALKTINFLINNKQRICI